LQIKKRDGSIVSFNFTKILNRIKKAAKGLKVNSDQIFINVITSMPQDGFVTTTELDNLIASTAASYTGTHYDYSKLAANIAISAYHKVTSVSFADTVSRLVEDNIIHNDLFLIIEKYGEGKVEEMIDYERDYNFNYFAWKTLEQMYLIKTSDGIGIERPQHMYMRIALWITQSIEEAKEVYDLLSNQLVSCATPIMRSAGRTVSQLSSCVLKYNTGDSRTGLIDTFKDVAEYSADGAGIGLCMSNIRSEESRIATSGGYAGGLLKYIKIINENLRFFNQQGTRPGVAAVYIEPWHKDVFKLLEIKKNQGPEELRARDIFTALWIPDNFMRAVENNDDWYLFCPNDIKKAGLTALQEQYGEDYERTYNLAVQKGLGKKIKAHDLFYKIIESQIETGVPYMLFKDAVNRKTNHQNLGVIKQSNLCAEIVQYTDELTTAICTLASQVIKNYIKDGKFDFNLLHYTTKVLTKILNRVIDVNHYSTDKGLKGGKEQRAIAIGVQGLADVFYMLDLTFTSQEARELNRAIFETIYHASIEGSMELVRDGLYDKYSGFEGSPMSKGVFQFDMWDSEQVVFSGMYDWDKLKKDVSTHGLANSLFVAQMPVASSAKVTDSYEMTEPMDSNLFNRRVLGGEFMIPNKYLVQDLEKLGIWSEAVKNEIIVNNGSIQEVNFLKYLNTDEKNLDKKAKRLEYLVEKYKTVWEFKQRDLIDLAADRAPFVDQTQSMNIYMANPTVTKITSSHLYSWKKGLKTGSYYMRTKAISTGAKHLAIAAAETAKQPSEYAIYVASPNSSFGRAEEPVLTDKPEGSPFDCEGCSA